MEMSATATTVPLLNSLGNGTKATGRRAQQRPRRRVAVLLAVLLAGGYLVAVPQVASATTGSTAAAAAAPGAYVPLAPTRLVDTRYGTGTPAARIPGGGTLIVQAAGKAGIPGTGVAALVATVNVLNAAAAGRLIVWAAGTTRPNMSSVNFVPRTAATSMVASQLSSSGAMAIWNSSTSPIDVVIDVSGYWAGGTVSGGGGFVPVTPSRSLDTRSGLGAAKSDWVQADWTESAASLSWQVTGRNGVPAGATAVVMAITATNVSGGGDLVPFDESPTVHPGLSWLSNGDTLDSVVSSTGLAYSAGIPTTELFVVPLSVAGKAELDVNDPTGTATMPDADVLGDVVGYIRPGSASGSGMYQPLPTAGVVQRQIAGGATSSVTLPVPASATAFISVTATATTSAGGLLVYQAGTARPGTRNLNFNAKQQLSTMVAVQTSAASAVTVANLSTAAVTVVIDMFGYARGAAVPARSAWAWGSDGAGTMGVGYNAYGTSVPAPARLSGVKAIEQFGVSSYAITDDGSLWSWGKNTSDDDISGDQLGLGDVGDQPSPQRVSTLHDVRSVVAGYSYAIALQGDGTVWAWGTNLGGILGTGGSEASSAPTPVKVAGPTAVVAIGAGTAVDSDGSVWAWGPGAPGPGCGGDNDTCPMPVQIAGLQLPNVVQLDGSFALRSDGTVVSWSYTTAPAVISNLTTITALGGGTALKSDGTVWALPDSGTTASQIPGLTSVTAVGDNTAVTSDGTVWDTSTTPATRVPLVPLSANIAPVGNLMVGR